MGHDYEENYHIFEVTFETTLRIRVDGEKDEYDAQAVAEKALDLSWTTSRGPYRKQVLIEADISYGHTDNASLETEHTQLDTSFLSFDCIDGYEEEYDESLAEELSDLDDEDEEAA